MDDKDPDVKKLIAAQAAIEKSLIDADTKARTISIDGWHSDSAMKFRQDLAKAQHSLHEWREAEANESAWQQFRLALDRA